MLFQVLFSGLCLSFIILLPLGIKWELDRKIVLTAASLIGIVTGAGVMWIVAYWDLTFPQALILQIFLITGTWTSFLVWRFYRDPERAHPEHENAVLSPADGRIIYVKRIENGEVPFSEKNGKKFPLNEFVQSDLLQSGSHLIGIAMNLLDVHVNRAPIGGTISLLKRIKGRFISLKRKEAVVENERVLTIIENDHLKVGIVQIASRLVRRIVPYLVEGSEVGSGQRIGMIRFGSQVDLILPDLPFLCITVGPGEKVKASESIIAVLQERNEH